MPIWMLKHCLLWPRSLVACTKKICIQARASDFALSCALSHPRRPTGRGFFTRPCHFRYPLAGLPCSVLGFMGRAGSARLVYVAASRAFSRAKG